MVVNFATNEPGTFEAAARAAASLAPHFDVRLVVSHLARPNLAELRDPGDPYLRYSINFGSLFSFVVPEALTEHLDAGYAAENLALLERKMEIVRRLGMKGAFFGREPVYLPEAVYRERPEWRGPRVDHPRRSRNPVFAPCVHRREVQTLYRASAAALAARAPELDTYYWWTNDSGSGFCWYPDLYPGANGPAHCASQGPLTAMAAFHGAVLDGAREGGAEGPLSLMTQTRIWDERLMPAGAYHYPSGGAGGGRVASLRADLSLTYPVRYVWDALGQLEEVARVTAEAPVAVVWWLSDVYYRTHADLATVRRACRLWRRAAERPAAARRLQGRLGLLEELAAGEFGEGAAPEVVEGYAAVSRAMTRLKRSPFARPMVRFLTTYGAVSHRWLTRPMVAFPEELSAEEEDYFLPHVFAVGESARRSDLLDVHGYPAALPGEAHDLRSRYLGEIVSHWEEAGRRFRAAAECAEGEGARELEVMARAVTLLACIWRTCRNWLEYAGLRGRARVLEDGELARMRDGGRARSEAFRRELHAVTRSEMDNVLALQRALGEDEEAVLARATSAQDEDTFSLPPDVQAQLTRKREIMLAHWQEVARLAPVWEG